MPWMRKVCWSEPTAPTLKKPSTFWHTLVLSTFNSSLHMHSASSLLLASPGK